ncbi:RIP metalloprotease RseP [Helicobacter mustelae]|uniref:Zinc metalloprotease n=1 Tax=Helicobacter mustelae (strain ATCC 43772 / CCUG 25715 / CIP 103759 / LMG 18044 / NCTC 12198 / R85-136P) TaxID=679897 RepID=D3UGU5_HELM1|nr:RIP metalloprotease RseP [Helicobacter mustelae]CBG39716.1 putative membrane-associated zinc metalloprotease [Helicobacter mustelae 12198]SQH71222.1 membrane-associated zinc metalloprotease [Helicobacter mustelae]STP12350.1 membrane-associated zinc metalloprotease [Helicobacter mustelae]
MFILFACLILAFLIFFHELGHFLAAKLFGIHVEVFSIGFGKKLLTKTHRGTEYALSLIPLGGYVKLKGQNDLDALHSQGGKDSYSDKNPLVRIAVLFAGPFFNLILAFLIYVVVAMMGIQVIPPVVGKVLKDSPAYEAGILPGDRILSINNQGVNRWNQVYELISQEQKIQLRILRNNMEYEFFLQTKPIEDPANSQKKHYRIGIVAKNEIETLYLPFDGALEYGCTKVWESSFLILSGLQKLLQGAIPMTEISGPVMIVDSIAQFAQKDFVVMLLWVALISVNLGILNLLPIPALDGGQILFNLYELLTRKPLHEQGVKYLTLLGWLILLGLMSLGLYNDIARIFTQGALHG